MYKLLIRPVLFQLAAENAHQFTFVLLKVLQRIPGMQALIKSLYSPAEPNLKKQLFGLEFQNPVGLAAGFDKNAEVFNTLGAYGFGFVEIGTLTPKSQPGNPKPRLFRLPKDQGLINRMGFNNNGVGDAVKRLKKKRLRGLIVGGNIGKNKVTANEDALQDYLICLEELFPYVDYFVVNVSSPNTPGLRELQDKEPLTKLLLAVQERNAQLGGKPLLLKIAPDLSNSQLDDIVAIAELTKLAGIVATNTTISRDGLSTARLEVDAIGAGGLSGKPLKERATEVIKYLRTKGGPELKIIGVGGIFTPEDALEKLQAGADLVQVYSGFIYEGPSMPSRINKFVSQAIKSGKLKWS